MSTKHMLRPLAKCFGAVGLVSVLVCLSGSPACGATFNITYEDLPGVGFEDATPVGGGMTLGDQRKAQMDAALATIDAALGGSPAGIVDIRITASEFDGTGDIALADITSFYPTATGFSNSHAFEHYSTGVDPDGSNPFDMALTVDFGFSINSDSGPPAPSEFDLQSLLLRESVRAFGFTSLLTSNGDSEISNSPTGSFSNYDSFLEDDTGTPLFSGSGQFDLSQLPELTSGTPMTTDSNVFFDGPNATAANGGSPVQLFAPTIFDNNTSVERLVGAPAFNSAMSSTPIATGQQRRVLSAVEQGILNDFLGLAANDTTVRFDGATPDPVDFGRVMQNQTPSVSLTVDKTGNETTIATVSGNNDGLVGFSLNFPAGPGSQSDNLTLDSTANGSGTLGDKNFTVTLDNEATTSAGAGLGSADPGDSVSAQATVVTDRVITPDATVDFGTVITGASVSDTVTLNTTGADNMFTRVTVNDTAVAADTNGIGSPTGTTTLFNDPADTTVRTLSGTITNSGSVPTVNGTVDFSVTGEGLTGENVNPVSADYTAQVLAHSEGSFSGTMDQDVLNLDFGQLNMNPTPSTIDFDIFNFEAIAGLNAGLELTAVNSTGDDSVLTINLTPVVSIDGGNSQTFTASFDRTQPISTYSASYTISTADESLPGGTAGNDLILNIQGEIVNNPFNMFVSDSDGLWTIDPPTQGTFVPDVQPGAYQNLNTLVVSEQATDTNRDPLNPNPFDIEITLEQMPTDQMTVAIELPIENQHPFAAEAMQFALGEGLGDLFTLAGDGNLELFFEPLSSLTPPTETSGQFQITLADDDMINFDVVDSMFLFPGDSRTFILAVTVNDLLDGLDDDQVTFTLRQFLIQVPEPSTFALWTVAAMALYRGRRRKS